MSPEHALDLSGQGPQGFLPLFSRSIGSWQVSVARRPFAPQELAARYDQESDRWDETLARHGFAQAYRALVHAVMRRPKYRQDVARLKVLDVGVGTGALSHALRQELDRRFQLTGVDVSAEMLRKARTSLSKADIAVTLDQADVQALPHADNSFDIVLAAHVIEHLPDPAVALREMARVLKPGGVMLCCITRQSRTGRYVQLVWRTHSVARLQAVEWLRKCGLEDVRAVPFPRHTTPRRFSIGYVGRKPGSV